MRKSTELQTAYVHFAHAVGRLLESKGARHDHGVYTLDTPGGPLMLRPVRNWIFGRFANPVGGFIVTDGLSQPHSGRWATNFHDNAEALTADGLLDGFEFELDCMMTFEVTAEQREAIEREAQARERLAAACMMHECEAESAAPFSAFQSKPRYDRQPAGVNVSLIARFDGTSSPRPVGQ